MDGRYVFDSSVVVNGNTQYWLYSDSLVVLFLGSGPGSGSYGGGNLYGHLNNDINNPFLSLASEDAQFRLSGDPVPEPSTFALLGLGALGLFVAGRRNAASRST